MVGYGRMRLSDEPLVGLEPECVASDQFISSFR